MTTSFPRYDVPPGDSESSMSFPGDSVNPFPHPEHPPQRPTTLPILRVETADEVLGVPFSPTNSVQSPAPKVKLYTPKKKYSVGEDSLRHHETPVFTKQDTRQKKGPSSPTTVLTMAGLFVCGITLMMSGIIVLCQQNEKPFIIAGGCFLGLGSAMIIVCGLLQRKNVVKYVIDLNRDLYFLKMSDSYMWKLMFRDDDSELPLPHQE